MNGWRFVVLLIPLALVTAGIIKNSLFRVYSYERLVVYRLGKAIDVRGPGFVILIPILQSGVKYDITDPLDARLIRAYQQQFGQIA